MAINELSDKRYLGKVCSKHPEFNGLRAKSSSICVQCASEKKVKKRVSRGTKPEQEKVLEAIDRLKKRVDASNEHRAIWLAEIERLAEYHEKLISEPVST
jgi:hypothetical protein